MRNILILTGRSYRGEILVAAENAVIEMMKLRNQHFTVNGAFVELSANKGKRDIARTWKTVQKVFQFSKDVIPVVLVTDDLFVDNLSSPECNYVLGQGIEDFGVVLSTFRLLKDVTDEHAQIEILKTLVMHELGHALGLPGSNRPSLVNSLGPHCTENCIMRQGLNFPTDWFEITKDRLNGHVLCKYCEAQLLQRST